MTISARLFGGRPTHAALLLELLQLLLPERYHPHRRVAFAPEPRRDTVPNRGCDNWGLPDGAGP